MPALAWYLKRLRVMSGHEILHRAGQQLSLLSLLAQYHRGGGVLPGAAPIVPRFAFCRAREPQLPTPELDAAALRAAAPSLLKGEMTVGGRTWRWEPAPNVWHRAPDSGRLWPKRFFAAIAYREGNPVGDIRQLWEPARLQHLVDLAVIARAGDAGPRRDAVRLIRAQLASWAADNPALAGAHYISAMECALRMIALCHALDLIREDLDDDAPWMALLAIVATHAPLIARRLSLHSSAGNHTAAEAAGLVYAGLLFPEMAAAPQWLATGLALLDRESARQVLPDGGGAEQALGYHRFTIQLLALVQGLLEHHGQPAPPAIAAAVLRGGRFLAVMGAVAIGDGDDGCALSRYLVLPAGRPSSGPEVQVFEHAGYTVAEIGSSGAPMTLIFDHGPLGMPPSFGHGHADALAVLLTAGGEPVLVDTGTYTYTGDPQWRRFFRGTPAHNTITVDGCDQAVQEACFLWSRPYRAGVIAADVGNPGHGRVLAEHDGYRHLGVRHVRGVAWSRGHWLLIWDGVFGAGRHLLELHWHFAVPPAWRDIGLFELATVGGLLECRCEGGDISTLSASRTPLAGWRSSAYGVVEPLTTVRMSHEGELPHTYTTLIRLPGGGPDHAIQEALAWMTERAR